MKENNQNYLFLFEQGLAELGKLSTDCFIHFTKNRNTTISTQADTVVF